jgi:hypothetical protein
MQLPSVAWRRARVAGETSAATFQPQISLSKTLRGINIVVYEMLALWYGFYLHRRSEGIGWTRMPQSCAVKTQQPGVRPAAQPLPTCNDLPVEPVH